LTRAIEQTRSVAKGNDVEAIKSALAELEQASHAVSKALYESAARAGAGAAAATGAPSGDGGAHPAGAPAGEEEPIDAEFEVKDKK
jgi:molecular chaperone DnaK